MDLACETPGAARPPIGIRREQSAERPQEGIGRVGHRVTLRRFLHQCFAKRVRDPRRVRRACIQRRLDALLDRYGGVTAYEGLADTGNRHDGQMRVAAPDTHRRERRRDESQRRHQVWSMRGQLQRDGAAHRVAHHVHGTVDIAPPTPLVDGGGDRARMAARRVVAIARRRGHPEAGQVDREGGRLGPESLHQGDPVECRPAEAVDHDHGGGPFACLADMDLARPEGPALRRGDHHLPMGPRGTRGSALGRWTCIDD